MCQLKRDITGFGDIIVFNSVRQYIMKEEKTLLDSGGITVHNSA